MVNSLSRRQEAVELAVFLLLIVPSLVVSFADSSQASVAFPLVAVATILRDLGLLALVLLLLRRASQPLADIGWVRRGAWREAGLGLLLAIPVLVGANVLEALLRAAGLSGPSPTASSVMPRDSVGEILLAVILVVVVAVT